MHKKLALTPPMGWNSWDCYGAAVNEEQLLANADYMAANAIASGYVLGGTGALADDSVLDIFALESAEDIVLK